MVTGAGRLREGGRDMVIDPGRPEDETPGMGGVQVLKEIVYASCKINKYKRETGVYLIFFFCRRRSICHQAGRQRNPDTKGNAAYRLVRTN